MSLIGSLMAEEPAPRGDRSGVSRCTERACTGPHGRARPFDHGPFDARRFPACARAHGEGHEAVAPLIRSSRFPKPCRYPYRDPAVAADRTFPRDAPRRGCLLRHLRAPRHGATGTNSLPPCRFAPLRALRPRGSPHRLGRPVWMGAKRLRVCGTHLLSRYAPHRPSSASCKRPAPSHTQQNF